MGGKLRNLKSTDQYDTDGENYWPNAMANNLKTHLPWAVDYSYSDSSHSTMISSTIMVWYWQQYTKYVDDATTPMHPNISTRYADATYTR
jgi:hypothetical protein